MNVQITPYGPLLEVLGEGPFAYETEAHTASALLQELQRRNPQLARWENRIACACGAEMLQAQSVLRSDMEIALIPPVSGG